MLKKNYACLRDFEDQAWDVAEALWKNRFYHEETEKKEEELRSVLEEAQNKIEKHEGSTWRGTIS